MTLPGTPAGAPGGPEVLDSSPGRRRGGLRRPLLVATAVSALAVLAAAAPSVAGRSADPERDGAAVTAVGAPAPPPRAVTCPDSTVASADGTGAYGVRFRARIDDIVLNNGWSEQFEQWTVVTTGISAEACGLLQLPSLEAVIEPEGLVFDTSKSVITIRFSAPSEPPTFGPGVYGVDLDPSGPASTTIAGVRPGGELDLTAATPLVATVKAGPEGFGTYRCPSAIDSRLTTGTSTVQPEGRGEGPWTVTGTPLTGALIGATATVVGNDFAIPVFTPKPPCDSFQGSILNPAFSGYKDNGPSPEINGDPYYETTDPAAYGPAHAAGTGQVRGVLTITEVDEDALHVDGPPATVPGT